jgi:hypothetical protein
LSAIREDPSILLPDRTREIRGFRLTLTRDLGLNRAGGRGSFIDSVVLNVKSFYGDVLQNLTAWKPRAPKLRAGSVEEELVEAPPRLADALEQASAEGVPDAPSAR